MGTNDSRESHISTTLFMGPWQPLERKQEPHTRWREWCQGTWVTPCVLVDFWSGNAPRNPRARPESLQHCVPQMARATGHTLLGRAFQSRPHRSCPHTSSGAGLLLASWCLSYPANGHTAISQLLWAGKPDKTKVPFGDTSQFTEC